MERVDYDARQHAVYAAGRAMPDDMRQTWAEVFAAWAPPERPLTVLDLGSGTGRFTPTLAGTFGGPVYGVEPSERMREQAAPHPGVEYRAGRAEAIPLPDRSCDLVLMFLMFHHVVDRPAAVAEIRRVLRPGGRVLLHSTFADRMPDLLWHRFIPGARTVEQRMFPTLTEVVRLFGAAGMPVVAIERVREKFAPSLSSYAARMRLRPISTFEHLTEDEIVRGLTALDRAAAAETTPRPVTAEVDLLVLGTDQSDSASTRADATGEPAGTSKPPNATR
ncbi:class I SAM-dependent methyltransferase [Actinoplanes sp. CA-030573]|uniref:class I SAM-dependent methyltransferase n=1 Tax=Actinoplanes sp. CA-030573 TaxID=3239898 RepID=UPI003D8F39BA